ncbi:MAG TPA: methylated-DNA--[protein]-cysteine S-methyltransferase [Rhizobacter sp.]|nr:methylated-DNA--[protein]-cysteine S-methyltransferase [Rhizobacter sp.]
MHTGCTVFDTAIGRCGIAWGERGITAFQLPEPSDAATLHRMFRRGSAVAQGVPPPEVQDAIERIVALLQGEAVDLRGVQIDYDGIAPFNRRVYEISREILPGQTRTYGDIAAELGDLGVSRAVGQALGANPFAIIVPCHRVLAAGGRSGGFSAGGGVSTKLRLLLIERAQFGSEPGLF